MHVELVVFDLDGTLVDSAKDIAVAARESLVELELWEKHCTVDEKFIALTNKTIGYGLSHTIEKLIDIIATKHDREVYTSQKMFAIDKGIEYYLEHPSDHTKIFDGVTKMLEDISSMGIKIAILSNKDHNLVQKVVHNLFPHIEWHAIQGAKKELKRKPHPETFLTMGKGLSSLMVGDVNPDVELAINANVPFVGAGWGYYEATAQADEHWVFDMPQDFVDFLHTP